MQQRLAGRLESKRDELVALTRDLVREHQDPWGDQATAARSVLS